MKCFAFLFSFYLLTLNCLPCGDAEECNEKEKYEMSTASSQHEQEHDSESCTPFCSCACCSTPVFYPVTNLAKQISLSVEKDKTFRMVDDFDSYDAHNVWQPPRA